jgi:hypothetical protein
MNITLETVGLRILLSVIIIIVVMLSKEVRNTVRRVANATQTILATPPLKS